MVKKMKDRIGIIVIVLSCIVFFGVFAASYYIRNYSDIKTDITFTSAPDPTSDQTAAQSSGKSTRATVRTTSAAVPTTAVTDAVSVTSQEVTMPYYIDINSAGRNELMSLEGIGEVLADAIIGYREQNGGFSNIEEIMNVSGIGEGIFAAISERIYVPDPHYETDVDEDTEILTEYTESEEVYEAEDTTSAPLLTLDDCVPIDINTADKELLMLLPDVDDNVAEEIIQLRERLGRFNNSYELLFLESLSRAQVAEITKYVTVGDTADSSAHS